MPTLSVVIPVYNRASVIKRAVDSVLAQTFTDLEVIAVDDGSTDSTVDVLHSIRDERVHCIISPENRGAGAARNQGILAARGEFIAFLDSDDEWLPQKAASQVALLQSLSNAWGICATGGQMIVDGSRKVMHRPNEIIDGNAFRLHALGKLRYVTPSLMLRRSCIEHVGLFDVQLRRGQDSEFLLRVLRHFKLAILPDPLVVCHIQTGKPFSDEVEKARLIIIKKHEDEVRQALGHYAARYFRANNLLIISQSKFSDRKMTEGVLYLLRASVALPTLSLQRGPRILGRALIKRGLRIS